jgi:hypothetical protein
MLDGTIFHFAEGQPETRGVEVIVYVNNIKAYYDDCVRRGLETDGEPEARDFGQTQFSIKDSNGDGICFTETTESNPN